jgi:hypothetical protein
MLAALAAGTWGYFIEGSTLLLALFAAIAIVGMFGIGLTAVGYFARGHGRR